MERTATVFGGSGFIGRYIVKRLANAGYTVRVAVRDPEAAHFLQPMGNVGQIVRLPVAVQDDEAVRWALDGADVAVNLVGIMHETGGAQTFEQVQAQAPARIARAANDAGVKRFVQLSALGADADSPSIYARTKAQGEWAVLEAFPDAAVLRPSIVVGPEDSFFNRFARMATLSPVIPLIGGGTTRFQPVYAGDVADAAMATLTRANAKGRIHELGGPRIYTFKQLMELMLQQIRRKRLLLPIPFALAEIQARILELLPSPPLTRDQLRLLKVDNVVSGEQPTFADLDLSPQAIEAVLPRYMDVYRPGGRFNVQRRTS